jgi:NADH dehydrogenase
MLMSANGVKADGTPYQKTKYMADQYLQTSGLDWTIIRPSVVFGDPRGRMEFATQLYRDIVSKPVPAPLFYEGLLPFGAGSTKMSPVHVLDVARVLVTALEREESKGRIYHLGGPEQVSWKQILETIGAATGTRVFGAPVPVCAIKTVASMLGGLDILPVTRDQITMLMEGNTCDSSGVFREFGIEPVTFDAAHLQYLNEPSTSKAGESQDIRRAPG